MNVKLDANAWICYDVAMVASFPSETVVLAWARLVRVQQTVIAAVERDLKEAGHPPLAWYDVLLELKRAGSKGLRPHEIESRLFIAQHNVSRLIDRLEREGLLGREACDDDGRGHMVVPTADGLALLKRMWPDYGRAIQRHVGAKLGVGEADSLARLLALLAAPSD